MKNSETKLNLYQKIARARTLVQDSGIAKGGKNAFAKYSYFELGDFLPDINRANDQVGLLSVFRENKDNYALLLFDAEDMDRKAVAFTCRKATANLKGNHDIQNLGAILTYSRRYLYMQAYEIAEADAIDAGERKTQDTKKPAAAKRSPMSPTTNKPRCGTFNKPADNKPPAAAAKVADKPKTEEPKKEEPKKELSWEELDPWANEIGVSEVAMRVYHKRMTPQKAFESIKNKNNEDPSRYEYKAPFWEVV